MKTKLQIKSQKKKLSPLGPQKSFYTREYWYIYVAFGVNSCACAQDKAVHGIVIAITKNDFATKIHLESLVLMELKDDPQKMRF